MSICAFKVFNEIKWFERTQKNEKIIRRSWTLEAKLLLFSCFHFFFLGSDLIKQHCKNIGEIYIEKEVVQEPILYYD